MRGCIYIYILLLCACAYIYTHILCIRTYAHPAVTNSRLTAEWHVSYLSPYATYLAGETPRDCSMTCIHGTLTPRHGRSRHRDPMVLRLGVPFSVCSRWVVACIHTHTYIQTYLFVRYNYCVCTWSVWSHTCVRHRDVVARLFGVPWLCVRVYMYVWTHAWAYKHTNVRFVYMCVYIHTYITCMHAYIHVTMYRLAPALLFMAGRQTRTSM